MNGADQFLPASERLRIIVDRQLNLKLNNPGHPPQVRAQMIRKNQRTLDAIFQETWGGYV